MEYAVQNQETVFGVRVFITKQGDQIEGELLQQGRRYFAKIGHDMYEATLVPYDDCKRWMIQTP